MRGNTDLLDRSGSEQDQSTDEARRTAPPRLASKLIAFAALAFIFMLANFSAVPAPPNSDGRFAALIATIVTTVLAGRIAFPIAGLFTRKSAVIATATAMAAFHVYMHFAFG